MSLQLPSRDRRSAGEVFPAVIAMDVVDVVEHQLVVRAAQLLRQQAPEPADLRRQSGFRTGTRPSPRRPAEAEAAVDRALVIGPPRGPNAKASLGSRRYQVSRRTVTKQSRRLRFLSNGSGPDRHWHRGPQREVCRNDNDPSQCVPGGAAVRPGPGARHAGALGARRGRPVLCRAGDRAGGPELRSLSPAAAVRPGSGL